MIRRSSGHLIVTFVIGCILITTSDILSQVTWDQTTAVASSSFGNNRPRIVTNGAGQPLILWGKSTDAMYSRWDGSSFTQPVKLNPNGVTIATATWMGPEIAAHGDTVYVVYKQTPEDLVTSHIWLLRSFDGGATFSAPIQVENTGTDKSRFPSVTTDDDGHPIVAYMRFNSNFGEARWVVTRSFDFGETFNTDVLASGWSGPASDVCDCCPGTIHCSGQQVAIVYRDNNNNLRDSWAGISTDGGITFTKGVNIDQNGWMIDACPATGPDGVIVGDTLYSTFMNGQSGQAIVYYNETPINDLTTPPSTPVPGSGEGLQENFSRIDASGDAVALLWRHSADFSTGLALMFTAQIANGFPSSFDTLAYSQVGNGDVTVTDSHVFVAWQDNSSSNVKFRAGTYETSTTATRDISATQALTVFPNPASGELRLNAPVARYTIFDLSGAQKLHGLGSRIDIQSLPQGMYFLSTENGYAKFIKD